MRVLGYRVDGEQARVAVEHRPSGDSLNVRRWALRWSRLCKALIEAGPWQVVHTEVAARQVSGYAATVVVLQKVERQWDR